MTIRYGFVANLLTFYFWAIAQFKPLNFSQLKRDLMFGIGGKQPEAIAVYLSKDNFIKSKV
ncbi:hypothetical protein [Nostoc sp. FACHB-145]|uniref:hypothetical protein n=1 Tax=Nostoc sp. FACHB-145 TaxID=2692836 RepID=UPI00168978E0|nr:hypothetical protein [Nostoc sp. FACHB-145]MBD2468921.1 hypothetical protein [Nostoc sp. FACHB-145]